MSELRVIEITEEFQARIDRAREMRKKMADKQSARIEYLGDLEYDSHGIALLKGPVRMAEKAVADSVLDATPTTVHLGSPVDVEALMTVNASLLSKVEELSVENALLHEKTASFQRFYDSMGKPWNHESAITNTPDIIWGLKEGLAKAERRLKNAVDAGLMIKAERDEAWATVAAFEKAASAMIDFEKSQIDYVAAGFGAETLESVSEAERIALRAIEEYRKVAKVNRV